MVSRVCISAMWVCSQVLQPKSQFVFNMWETHWVTTGPSCRLWERVPCSISGKAVVSASLFSQNRNSSDQDSLELSENKADIRFPPNNSGSLLNVRRNRAPLESRRFPPQTAAPPTASLCNDLTFSQQDKEHVTLRSRTHRETTL